MIIELKVPPVGESITEVQIGEWLKSEGDLVKQDEPVAVLDSEKSTFELPAPQSGRLSKILSKAGESVAVGAVVAELEPRDAGPESSSTKQVAESAEPEKQGADPSSPANEAKIEPADAATTTEAPPLGAAKPSVPAQEIKAPPPSREPAGPSPEFKKSSVDREDQTVPMTMLRRTAARRLVEAQQTMAMLTTFNEADLSAVKALRHEYQEAFEKRYRIKLGLMSFFIKAAVDALKQYPQLNAEVSGHNIVYHHYLDVGVAVATERGLVVPVLRDADRMTFAELEKNINDFGQRAREGSLKPDELAGGTFTITNGGVFGSLLSTPIINPPQTAILGLHAIQERPVAVQGQVVIRPMMYLALTYDHRIVDGREAVLALVRIKQSIEAPARLLLEV
jgi:2-oxoglutarate dehydrogenase E2 component (dihydrolipoamide succinyltransferase)